MIAGDLVRYRCAGQRKKSLGLVVEVENDDLGRPCLALVRWYVTGEYLPREMIRANGKLNSTDKWYVIINNDYLEIITDSKG